VKPPHKPPASARERTTTPCPACRGTGRSAVLANNSGHHGVLRAGVAHVVSPVPAGPCSSCRGTGVAPGVVASG
jgi:hypothetical protein